MQEPAESTGNFKLREIMNELSTLFTDAIEQVRVILGFSFYMFLLKQNSLMIFFLMLRIFSFKVKEQCEFRTPLEDKIRVMVRSSALKAPISTRLIPSAQMTSSKVLGEITKVLQSNEEIPLDQSFTIDIIGVKAPTGSGKSLKVLDYSKDTHIKKSIITIKNKDNLCCGRALAVGKAIADNHSKVKQFKQGKLIQKKVALDLYKKANVLPGPCGLREISKFQGSLPGYQIIVIDFHARNTSIYEGPRAEKKIVLYKNGDHYNVVNPEKLPAFHGKRFFCEKCKSYFENYRTHPCNDPCKTCLRKECLIVSDKNVLVRTVLKFVVRLNVLTTTKSLASQRESNFLRSARHRSNVKRVRQMLSVNDKTTIGVVNVFVIFVRSMCCLSIYVTCSLNHLKNLTINLYFMILKLTFLQGSMLLTLPWVSIVMGRSLCLKGTMHCMNFVSFYFLSNIRVSRQLHTMQKVLTRF